jgi:Ca-activated chloride channel family protein
MLQLLHDLQTWFADPLGLPVRVALSAALSLVTLALFGIPRRRRALARLGGRIALLTLLGANQPRFRWRFLRAACSAVGLLLLVVGIAGPQWGRDWEKSTAQGRDLVVVLDASRSMLAEDVPPSANRLARAKEALRDLSQTVQERGGHRLALLAFTDRPLVLCPLTHDYDLFRAKLAEVNYSGFCNRLQHIDAAAQRSEKSPSGTRIGAALRKAVEIHGDRARGFQEILLISDGDDPADDAQHERSSGWEEARKHAIPIHTVGIGNPDVGSGIPLPRRFVLDADRGAGEQRYLEYGGKVVLTRLQEGPLAEIARRTGGTYTAARTNDLDLGELFRDAIEARGVREETDEALTLPVYEQRYVWFFAAGFALLAGQMLIGNYRMPQIRARPFIGWLLRRRVARRPIAEEAS